MGTEGGLGGRLLWLSLDLELNKNLKETSKRMAKTAE